ncbi:MAG: hypothetical protein DWQ58_17755 [Microcystis aeruginosa TA09]|nr:MAG: hypothetical protein DWQ58_17755 [Microcystis aeruginosa TA09]
MFFSQRQGGKWEGGKWEGGKWEVGKWGSGEIELKPQNPKTPKPYHPISYLLSPVSCLPTPNTQHLILLAL